MLICNHGYKSVTVAAASVTPSRVQSGVEVGRVHVPITSQYRHCQWYQKTHLDLEYVGEKIKIFSLAVSISTHVLYTCIYTSF